MNRASNVDVVQKLWGFCHTLRHDGIDYGDYIEQITYLLFLKMADERGIDLSAIKVAGQKGKPDIVDCSWPTLEQQSGTGLTDHYIVILRALGQAHGILSDIYAGAQNRFNNPVNLKKLVSLIDETEWTSLDVDVKAAVYEGLLERAAAEGKKGMGQFFTPRKLIESIVRCVRPDPRERPDLTVCDPACGTGGFLIGAYDWLRAETKGALDRELARRIRSKTFFGQDLGERARRLALMNLYLHGLEPHVNRGDSIYEPPPGQQYDVILANPPFGTRGAGQAPEREDFTIATANKQLNFLQHILTILKPGGRAAVILPDSVLFADQAAEVMKIITEDCSLHTVLRLPRGTFTPYSQSVNSNVIFFTKGHETERIWIFDARTNVPRITKKGRRLTAGHFVEFEECFGADANGRAKRRRSDSKSGRWRDFSITEIRQNEFKIGDLKWLKEESVEDDDELPAPEEIATEAIGELEAGLAELNRTLSLLERIDGEEMENGGALPEGWTKVPLQELLREPLRNGHSAKASADGRGVRTLTLSAVTYGDFSDRNTKMTVADPTKVGDLWLESGDLLIERSNTAELVGTSRLYRGPARWAIFPDLVIRARVSPAALPEFIELCLQSPELREYFTDAAQGTSDSMPKIDQGAVERGSIRLAPLPEQGRIVEKIEAVLEQLGRATARVTRASRLLGGSGSQAIGTARVRQALLSKAFAGELVPTEADLARAEGRTYETAEELLKRVRQAAENGGATETTKSNGRGRGSTRRAG